MPERPWMRTALKESEAQVLQKLRRELWTGIQKLAAESKGGCEVTVDVLEGFPAWVLAEPTVTALLSDPLGGVPVLGARGRGAALPRLPPRERREPPPHGREGLVANPMLQVECWADDLGSARALADALDQRLNHFRGDLGGVFAQGVFRRDRRTGVADPDDGSGTRRHVVELHYEVWRST